MHRVSYSSGTAVLPPHERLKPWDSGTLLEKGHPAIWKDDDLFEEACIWLNEEIVPTKSSPNTWAQAAQSLVTWLDYLEAAEVDWREASKADLASYRDVFLAGISPYTGKVYSPSTVAVRMTYIIDFIRFAVAQGWIESDFRAGPTAPRRQFRRGLMDEESSVDSADEFSAPARIGGVPAARLTKMKPRAVEADTVRVLSREELTALVRWSGPRPSERKPEDGGSDRDFVLFALAWVCGLRVQEIADLNVQSILVLSASPDALGLMCKLWITGKGGKVRVIDVPAWFVLDLKAYIAGERKRSLRKRGPRVDEDQLILNSEHSSRPGKPMSKSAMQNLMQRACAGAGLMREERRTNPETGETVDVVVPKYSMDSLRHTYAVMTYHNHMKAGFSEFEAWRYISAVLGHKSTATTIVTYGDYLSIWPIVPGWQG